MDEWPQVDKKKISKIKIKVAIQVNGRTKGIVQVEKDLNQKQFIKQIEKNDKISRFFKNKEVNKVIYVKNKIINFLIKDA